MSVERGPLHGVPEPPPRALATMLRVAAIATLTLAVLGALPGPVGDATAATAVLVVTVAPILRVAWLAVGWLRAGDLPFAVAAGVLLGVVLGGSGLAALFA